MDVNKEMNSNGYWLASSMHAQDGDEEKDW